MSSNLISSKKKKKKKMIQKIWIEWKNRILIIIMLTICITIITITYSNEIMLCIMNPIKEINNDLHNKIIYKIINLSYTQYDIEKKKEYIINEKIDYIPSCEISINIKNIWWINTKIILNSILFWAYIIIYYNIILTWLHSAYKHERQDIWKKYITHILKITTSIYLTQKIWTKIYWKMSLNNYYEYNYYEFDVHFDINEYINNYIKIIYITIIIMNIKNEKINIIILIIMWILKMNNIIETMYIYIIQKIIQEIHIWKKIKHNKR